MGGDDGARDRRCQRRELCWRLWPKVYLGHQHQLFAA
jgi:hypothetical protein